MDFVDCIWIVRFCLNCTVTVFGTGGVGLSQLYLDCVDCIWLVLIVFGLC